MVKKGWVMHMGDLCFLLQGLVQNVGADSADLMVEARKEAAPIVSEVVEAADDMVNSGKRVTLLRLHPNVALLK